MSSVVAAMSELPPSRFFPPVRHSTPDGLLAVGGELSPEWLLDAYAHAIFPWPIDEMDDPVLWWSPDPRAVFELDGFHITRRLRRTVRSGRFRVTCDQAFADVILECSRGVGRERGTWITPRIIDAYVRMHELGHAHSVEVWDGDMLAGGVYGVALGGLFAAESKFHRVRDASKVALVHLVSHLRQRGFCLMDIQQITPHTSRLGAIEIPRAAYLSRLADALPLPVSFGEKLEEMAVD